MSRQHQDREAYSRARRKGSGLAVCECSSAELGSGVRREGGKAVHGRDWVPSLHCVYEFFKASVFGVAIGQCAQDVLRPANGSLCSRRVVEAESRICDPQHVTGSHDLGSGFGEGSPVAGLLCDIGVNCTRVGARLSSDAQVGMVTLISSSCALLSFSGRRAKQLCSRLGLPSGKWREWRATDARHPEAR